MANAHAARRVVELYADFSVAQVGNLPYRRLAVGETSDL
jgi:hypothetical protein